MAKLKRDVTEMDLYSLQKYAEGLQDALLPFAHAAARCVHYQSPREDAPIFAVAGDTLFELLFNDEDVLDAKDLVEGEECRQLVVSDLDTAVAALHGKDHYE